MKFFDLFRKKKPDDVGVESIEFRPFEGAPKLKIFGLTGDETVFASIRKRGFYESEVVRVSRAQIHPGDTVLDVGANIGVLTAVFSRIASAGRVYAFEPGRVSKGLLLRNIKENSLRNVRHVDLAVTDKSDEELFLDVDPVNLGGGHISNKITSERVRTISIDDFVNRQNLKRVDFIKIDIEGAEITAINGAVQTILKHRPKLLVECNPLALTRLEKNALNRFYGLIRRCYKHIYIVPTDPYRDGVFVKIDSVAQLIASLSLGRGIDDVFCSPTPLSGTEHNFTAYLEYLKNRHGGRQLVLEPRYEFEFKVSRFRAKAGDTVVIPGIVKNLSAEPWSSSGMNPVNISYHLQPVRSPKAVTDNLPPGYAIADGVSVYDGERTHLSRKILPGESSAEFFNVKVPTVPGEYSVWFSPVQEGIIWFDEIQKNPKSIILEVTE